MLTNKKSKAVNPATPANLAAVKTACAAQGLTLAALAARIGVAPCTLSAKLHRRHGKQEPGFRRRLEEALGLDDGSLVNPPTLADAIRSSTHDGAALIDHAGKTDQFTGEQQ